MPRNVKTVSPILAALLAVATPAFAAPKVDSSATAVTVALDNGVTLTYALRANQLLGLNTAQVAGQALKSDKTLVRPILVQDKGKSPAAYDTLVFDKASVSGDTVTLSCRILPSDTAETFRRVFELDADGKPHQDYYLFPHLGLPSEVVGLANYQKVADATKTTAPAAGTLNIIIEPVTQNVAGWTWRGWKHHYELTLEGGAKLNGVRELSTWEPGGEALGNTLIALRYRGLGGIAPKLTALAGSNGAPPGTPQPVSNAFTTTEILPGAVDKAPVISPAVPGPQNIAAREEAMKYRHGAWIAQLQRGGGAPFIDFAYRDGLGFAAYYEKMEAVRSLTEVWPGDTCVSQTDCLYFPLSDKIATTPKIHVALIPPAKLSDHEWQTRYQETDQFVRALICKDLNLVQSEPLPTVGLNWDSGWEWRINQLIQNADALKAAGVRRVITHHPGWLNGRGLRQKETSRPIPQSMQTDPKKPNDPPKLTTDTGGDCSIHDYVPQSEKVEQLWKTLSRKLNDDGIEYWVWVTGMVYGTGPVVQQFGEARFTRNDPAVAFSSGYPGSHGRAGHRGISMRDPEMRQWFESRMIDASDKLGVQGIWADSFQNMFMSQMNYQHPDFAPQVREWWTWIAAESRKGVGFMSESTCFPQISCSVEVGDMPKDLSGVEFAMSYSTKWYRGTKVPDEGTEKADSLFFRTMANKGPIAPGDGKPLAVPSYKRLSDEYMAALPAMNRPYQLPEHQGVLWLSFESDGQGVIFPFVDMRVPAGLSATPILAKEPAQKLEAFHTYRITGSALLGPLGLQSPPEKDPRLGTRYVPPVTFTKDWQKESK